MGVMTVKSPILSYVDRFMRNASKEVKEIVFTRAIILKFENQDMNDLEAVFTAYSSFLKEVK